MFKLTKKQISLVIVAGITASVASTVSVAGDVKMYRSAPSAEEMGNILFSEEKKPAYRTRSISFGGMKPATHMQDAEPKSMPAQEQQAVMPQEMVADISPATIGLPIKFASNSSDIMDESLPFLNEVGKMMTMHSDQKLLIEGHTDALGSDDYNFILSYKRAKAVRNYLVQNFNLPESNLKINGKGESEPLDGSNPSDAVNRRVQFYKAN